MCPKINHKESNQHGTLITVLKRPNKKSNFEADQIASHKILVHWPWSLTPCGSVAPVWNSDCLFIGKRKSMGFFSKMNLADTGAAPQEIVMVGN